MLEHDWIPTLFTVAALALVGTNAVQAQAIVVQQPVVQQFGVNTVVSVPDRGSVLLGSVGSSENFARRTGPLGSGSNASRSVRHGSLWVHVTIHDFEAMDEALLAEGRRMEATDPSLGRRSHLNPLAANACRQLLDQHRRLPATQAATASSLSRLGSRSLR